MGQPAAVSAPGRRIRSELTSGKCLWPACAAHRKCRPRTPVLAVQGSHSRARPGSRALDGCGPACPVEACDGRLRREADTRSGRKRPATDLPSRTVFGESPASPRLVGTAGHGLCPGIGPAECFEAGELLLTQTSWPALLRSSKWMSDPADAWISIWSVQTADLFDSPPVRNCLSHLRPASRLGKGDLCLPLDSPLSWMSPNATA